MSLGYGGMARLAKQNTYSQYESEKRQIPLVSLIALARFYNTSTDYILGLTDVDKPY